MNRELLFSLAGFLAGFIVAFALFWQPSNGPVEPVAAMANARAAEEQGGRASPSGPRPIVVSAGGENRGETAVDEAPAPKSPAEMMHEMLASLPNLKPELRQAAVNDLIAKLRQMGPAGLQTVRDYLQVGQDVKLQGYAMVNGKMTMAPSLRVAFLNALGEWPSPDAAELTRDVLRSTTHLTEAAVAIRQLEAKSPGVYRTEAIQALLRAAASSDPKSPGIDGGTTIFEALRYFKAPELIAAAEKYTQNGWAAAQFAQALGELPANFREPAMKRLFANPDVVKQLGTNSYGLQSLNYADRVVTQNVAQMFASSMDRNARENFLVSFRNTSQTYGRIGMFELNAGQNSVAFKQPDAGEQKARLQSRLAFLDQIAPQCTTAVLQERLQDAREGLKAAIAKPPVTWSVGGGNSTVIQAGSSTSAVTVTGGGIQVNQTLSK